MNNPDQFAENLARGMQSFLGHTVGKWRWLAGSCFILIKLMFYFFPICPHHVVYNHWNYVHLVFGIIFLFLFRQRGWFDRSHHGIIRKRISCPLLRQTLQKGQRDTDRSYFIKISLEMYWELGCACVLTHCLVAVVVLRWFSQRRRKLIGQRPSNLPRSLLLAGKSFVMNVVLGISGLVTQPVRGEWPPCLSVMSVVLTSQASSPSLSVVSDPPVSLWWVSSSHLRPRHPACPWWVTPLSLCDECRPHISGLVIQPVRGEWPPCLSVMSVVLTSPASSPSLSVVSDAPVSLWWVSSSHLRPRHPACPWWVTPLSLCDECRPHISGLVTQPVRGEWRPCLSVMSVVLTSQASSPSLSVVSDPPVSLWWVSSSHLRPRHPACPWWVTPLSLCDECRPHISGLVTQPVRGEWPPCLSVMSVVLTSPASSPSLSVVSDPPVSLWWVSSSHLRPRHPACPWWVTPLSLCDECRPHISGLVTQPVRGEWPPCLSVMSVVLTSPASSPSLSVVSDPPVSLWWVSSSGLVTQPVRGEWPPCLSVMSVVLTSPASSPSLSVVSDAPVSLWWVSSSHLRPRHPACPWWVTPLSLCDECRPHISGLVIQPVRGEWPPCLSVMSVVLTSPASSPSLSVVSDAPVSLWWVSSSHLRPRHPACPWWVTPLSLCDECRPHISGLVTQPVRGEWPPCLSVMSVVLTSPASSPSLSVVSDPPVSLWWVSSSHLRPRHPACPWWVTPLSLCDECRPHISGLVTQPVRGEWPPCLSVMSVVLTSPASSSSLSVVSDPPVSLWWVSSSHLRPRHPACPWWVTPLSLCDECRPHISGLVTQPVRGEWRPSLCDECRPHISGLVTQPVRGEWPPCLSVMSVVLTSPASSPSLSVVSDPPVSLWWVSSSHLRPRHPAGPWWVTPLSLWWVSSSHLRPRHPACPWWVTPLSLWWVSSSHLRPRHPACPWWVTPLSLWWVSSSHLRPRHPACPWWVTPLSLCDECRPHISGLVTQPVRGEWPPCLSVMSVVLTSQASSPSLSVVSDPPVSVMSVVLTSPASSSSLSVVSDPPVSLWWVSSSHLRPRHPACPWWVTPLSLWWVSSSHLRPRHPACPWWVTSGSHSIWQILSYSAVWCLIVCLYMNAGQFKPVPFQVLGSRE